MNTPKALIYCRTASALQNSQDTAMDAQETRCRVYAESKSTQVEHVFSDQAVASTQMDRPGLTALLDHITANPEDQYIVIVDDTRRIARHPSDVVAFRQTLNELGVQLEAVSSAGLSATEVAFVETILAAQAELDDLLNDTEDA